MDRDEVMAHMFGQRDEAPPKLAPDVERLRLLDAYAAYGQRHEFKPGDIVRQKHQARCYNGIGENDLAVVLEIIDPPVMLEDDNGLEGFAREPVDLMIGTMKRTIDDGDFFFRYPVSSRRFEPVDE